MAKVAIAFLTKDRVELSKQTLLPLLQPDKFDLFWIDGSSTEEGKQLPFEMHTKHNAIFTLRENVKGGADPAICYALTAMLEHPNNYAYVGLLENDVLLPDDWFDKTFALFDRGRNDGLHVGAVSARAYQDRILIQRDGYAIMHNLGFGMQIMSRDAARYAVRYMRTGLTRENRQIFNLLSGLDIGQYWAFRMQEHPIVADWHQDALLASEGLASLALVPSEVQMIGQVPPLHQQGLAIADAPIDNLRSDERFKLFCDRSSQLSYGQRTIHRHPWIAQHSADGAYATIMPHHLEHLGAKWSGEWILKWQQGMGPFAYVAGEKGATLEIPVNGPCDVFVSGGKKGGRFEMTDTYTRLRVFPDLPSETSNPSMIMLSNPCGLGYRTIKLVAHDPGVTFYSLAVRDEQVYLTDPKFDWHKLPPVAKAEMQKLAPEANFVEQVAK